MHALSVAEEDAGIWFLTGSQDLYGEDTLRQVAEQSRDVAWQLDTAASVPFQVVWKPVLVSAEAIRRACLEATTDDSVIGVITWMHTFSPAKMWIAGMDALGKPMLHLHTQFNRSLPWADIDMEFMNLNQAAHGDREFGYLLDRMGLNRKIVAGHASDLRVQERVAAWARAAAAWRASRSMRIARFGDNMRGVAVTEGDKVGAQMQLGVTVDTYGVNDLVAVVDAVPDAGRRTAGR